MLNELTLKQKIIFGIIIGVVLIAIGLYGYTKLNEEGEIITDSQDFIVSNETNNEAQNETQIEVGEEKIIVHITGQIKKSGILELSVGARIADAISAAGGATEKADLEKVNLAYELQDGQKIYIPSKSDKEENNSYITTESGNNVIVEENNKGGSGKVNINQAGSEELQELPGIRTITCYTNYTIS